MHSFYYPLSFPCLYFFFRLFNKFHSLYPSFNKDAKVIDFNSAAISFSIAPIFFLSMHVLMSGQIFFLKRHSETFDGPWNISIRLTTRRFSGVTASEKPPPLPLYDLSTPRLFNVWS